MFFRTIAGAILAATGLTLAQVYDTQNSITAAVGTPDSDDPNTIGNHYNYWRLDANATTYDLTRSDRLPTTSPKTIPMLGSRPQALIEPNRTAFVIVDMQNFFLHPKLSPQAVRGRQAVQPTLNLIDAFRANGMKILWTNWGIDAFDLLTMPPGLLEGFSDDHQMNTTFCSDMGTVREEDGTEVALGGKLCRGAWNARPWAGLGEAMDEGLAAGTDLYFNKNRLSGLWGAQTPLGLYLQEMGITTLFFGGVNSDQCVWSTLIDAYFKGYDVVYVQDCAATASPWYAEEMVRYNADLDGFMANSTYIIDALERQK